MISGYFGTLGIVLGPWGLCQLKGLAGIVLLISTLAWLLLIIQQRYQKYSEMLVSAQSLFPGVSVCVCVSILFIEIWEFPKMGVPHLGGPYNKDPTI